MPNRTRSFRPSLAAVLYGLAALSTAAAVGFALLASSSAETAAGPAIATALCASAFVFASVRVVGRRVARGSQSLRLALDAFATGDMGARADARSGVREIDALAESFNSMAGRVAQSTRRLAHEAFHDTLTGLPNRAYFMSRFRAALAESPIKGGCVAVLCLDLDRFKVINDTLGHAVGDELLSVLAIRLASIVGPERIVARLGGDEFTVLMDQTGEGEVAATAQRIVEALRRSFNVAGHELFVTVSVGVAMSQRGVSSSANDLLRKADIALYRAKGDGASRFVVFRPELDAHSPDSLELESGLRRAIDRGELVLHYQPEIELATGDMIGMEALVRWQHGQRGLISPAQFIPMAEETGEIVRIGQWVLDEACRQTAELLRRFPDMPLCVAVNVSAREFRQPDIVRRVASVLAITGLPPHLLELEITESAVIDDLNGAIDTLNRLRDLGVRLAIDDFGTGYSSLSYLHRMPLTTLKIDRSFIKDVGTDRTPSAVARAIVDVADALGIEVVAEGIETKEQLNYLRMLRCKRGQGFLFSKPLDLDSFTRLIEHRASRRPGAGATAA